MIYLLAHIAFDTSMENSWVDFIGGMLDVGVVIVLLYQFGVIA